MATIGSISVMFEANLKGLETGIEDVIDLFDDLSETVDDLTSKLDSASSKTIKIKTSADTNALKKASKEIKDLEDEVEKKSPTVKVKVDAAALSSLGKQFSGSVSEQVKEYGASLADVGKKAAGASRSVGSAANAIGDALDGTRTSLDGVVVAVSRSIKAYGNWKVVIGGAAAATGAFIAYAGGTNTVLSALSGNLGSSARLMAAFGAGVTSAVVGMAAYAGIMAIARVATAGMSEEARNAVQGWVSLGAAVVAFGGYVSESFSVISISTRAGNAAFEAIYQAMGRSSTAAQFFGSVMKSVGDAASSVATRIAQNIGGILSAFALVTVASGKFGESLRRLGGEAEGIRNMADRFGATTAEMEVLAYAARSASVGMGQLAKASQAFFTNVSKVKIGQLNTASVQEAKFAFDRLGISISDLQNNSPQEVFSLVSSRLLEVTDASDRAAIAFDLFGKQAVNVLPALRGLKEAAADAGRLGTAMSGVNFSSFEQVDQGFDRAREASANFGEVMLASFAPLQAGVSNFIADLVGGIVSAIAPIRAVMGAATKPIQAYLEIAGRLMNMLLRGVGVITQFFAAMTDAAALGPAWQALTEVIKDQLSYLESMISAAEGVARAFNDEMNPSIAASASVGEKLIFVARTFATVALAGGIATAMFTNFIGATRAAAIASRVWAAVTSISFSSVLNAIRMSIKFVIVDVNTMAAKWVSRFILMGTATISGLLTPLMTTVAGVIPGLSAVSAASLATGLSMAAAWVIGTAGLALIAIALVAVYNNFGALYEYFSNFGSNIGKLLTPEGLVEAWQAITGALKQAFVDVANFVTGFFGNIITGIIKRISGIKTPEKITAASASVADVVASRQGQQGAKYSASVAAAEMIGRPTDGIKMPTEDIGALTSSLQSARQDLIALSLNAAEFGETGRKAFLAAKADFDKLQQQLADDKIELKIVVEEDGTKRTETSLEAFERRTKEIRKGLEENLSLSDVISNEQLQQSAEGARKTIQDAFAQIRTVMRGQDLGSDLSTDRFFPASKEIQEQAEKFGKEYQKRLIEIEQDLQSGKFGGGQSAMEAAQQAREGAKTKFDRNMGKIDADVSFASEIRKALEDAFLTPVQKYEKKLKEIANNKSLNPQEKSLATIVEQKQMVEGTFGKSAGQSLREKEGMFASAAAVDEYGRTAFTSAEGSEDAGKVRESAERTKLDIERRKAVGLDASPAQQLKAGADNIADIFNVAGKSLAEIQKELGPEKFAEYQEAIKKNADAVKESLGIQKPATAVLADGQKRLAQAVAEGVISQDEAGLAARKLRDDFMSAIGVTKTPFENFSSQIDDIAAKFGMAGQPLDQVREKLKGNADQLALFDRAVKEARDNLLSSLGIEKTPQEVFNEQMKKIDEAANATDPNKKISDDQAKQARLNATRKRDEALGADTANNRASKAAEQRRNIEQAFGKNGENNKEAFDSAMENLKKSMPGSSPESPVKKFQDSMKELNYLKGSGALGAGDEAEKEFAQRKLELQAQLQEDIKPALEKVSPDRRAVESADTRSKEGVDTFFRILRGNDNPSLKAQLEIARNTRDLAAAAKDKDAAPVIAQLAAH